MQDKAELKEVYSTPSGCVYQCDKQFCFYIEFGGQVSRFNLPCFFSLKRLVDSIDLDSMILNPEKSADVEIINPCGSERIFVLTVREAIEFKDLMSGTRVMLELNSIIRERLHSVCF